MSHVVTQTFEMLHVIQAANFIPWLLGKPGTGIGEGIVQTYTTGQKETPFSLIHLQTSFSQQHAITVSDLK